MAPARRGVDAGRCLGGRRGRGRGGGRDRRAGGGLADRGGAAAARRLALAGADCAPYRLVLSGRVLSPGHPVLHERLLTALAAALPAARPRRLSVAPAAGAVLEAADVLGLADQAFSARLLVDAPAAHDP